MDEELQTVHKDEAQVPLGSEMQIMYGCLIKIYDYTSKIPGWASQSAQVQAQHCISTITEVSRPEPAPIWLVESRSEEFPAVLIWVYMCFSLF